MEKKIEYATPTFTSKLKKISIILMPVYAILLLISYPAQEGECVELFSSLMLIYTILLFPIMAGIMLLLGKGFRKSSPEGYAVGHITCFYSLVIMSPFLLILFKNLIWWLRCDFWLHIAIGMIGYIPFWMWATKWINEQVKHSDGGK